MTASCQFKLPKLGTLKILLTQYYSTVARWPFVNYFPSTNEVGLDSKAVLGDENTDDLTSGEGCAVEVTPECFVTP